MYIYIYVVPNHFLNFPLLSPGGCCGSESKRTIIGGWGWAWWLVTNVQELVAYTVHSLLYSLNQKPHRSTPSYTRSPT